MNKRWGRKGVETSLSYNVYPQACLSLTRLHALRICDGWGQQRYHITTQGQNKHSIQNKKMAKTWSNNFPETNSKPCRDTIQLTTKTKLKFPICIKLYKKNICQQLLLRWY